MAKNINQLTSLNQQQKLWLLLGGLLLLLVVVLGPVIGKLRLTLSVNQKLTKQLKELESKRESLEGIDAVLIEVRTQKMEAVFPSKKPVVQLMASLSQLAQEYNLDFGQVTLKPGELGDQAKGKKGSGLKDLRFGFEVQGSFDQIAAFMHDLENTAPLMKIEGMSLAIKSNPLFDSTEVVVVAGIDVSAFYQALPESLGPINKPLSLLSREDEALLNRLVGFKIFTEILPLAPTGKRDLFAPQE